MSDAQSESAAHLSSSLQDLDERLRSLEEIVARARRHLKHPDEKFVARVLLRDIALAAMKMAATHSSHDRMHRWMTDEALRLERDKL